MPEDGLIVLSISRRGLKITDVIKEYVIIKYQKWGDTENEY